MWGGKKAGSRTLCFCLGAPDAASCRSEHACEGFQSSWDVDTPTAGSRRLPPLFTTVNPPYIFWIYLTSVITITILGMKEDDCLESEQRTGEGEGDPSALSAW